LSKQRIKKGQKTKLCLQANRNGFEDLTGRTHPGTQSGSMGSGFVMGVVCGMRDDLRIDHCAQEQDADGQSYRNNT